MVKHYMIALLCTILTSLVKADIVSFNIDQGIEHGHDEYEFMVVSLINPENENSKILDSLMDGAEHYYQKMVKNKDWEKRSLIWLRSQISPEDGEGGI